MINCFFNNQYDVIQKFKHIESNIDYYKSIFKHRFNFIFDYPFVLDDDMCTISLKNIGYAYQIKEALNDPIVKHEYVIFIQEFNASLKPINIIRLEKLKNIFDEYV